MSHKFKLFLSISFSLLFGFFAWADPPRPRSSPASEKFDGAFNCSKFATKNIGCDPVTVVANCEKALKSVPNKKAINYTLEYFFENHGKLQDPSCAIASSTFSNGVFPEDEIRQGIQSSKFVLRDLNTLNGSRVDSYFFDLCNGDYKQFKGKVGTGTLNNKKGLVDTEGEKTTLAGAFLTDDKTSTLIPGEKSAKDYVYLLKQYPGRTRVALLGLNSSNNDTAFGKPFHLSPYNTSSGCPSIDEKDHDVLDKMASSGRSLLMSYDEASMQKLGEGSSCQNGEGRPDFNGGRVVTEKPQKNQTGKKKSARRGGK